MLTVLGLGAVLGFMKGFIRQLASLLGLIVGLLAAKTLYASLAVKLSPVLGDSPTFAQGLSFVLIWLAVPLLFAIVASLLTKLMEAIALGGINRLLGALLGLLKSLLLVSIVVGVIEFVDTDHHWIDKASKDDSTLYYPIVSLADLFFPVAKTAWEEL